MIEGTGVEVMVGLASETVGVGDWEGAVVGKVVGLEVGEGIAVGVSGFRAKDVSYVFSAALGINVVGFLSSCILTPSIMETAIIRLIATLKPTILKFIFLSIFIYQATRFVENVTVLGLLFQLCQAVSGTLYKKHYKDY